MSIAWLWFYTDSVNPGSLRASNQERAFTVNSRWQSLLGWLARLHRQWRRFRQERVDNLELQDLSEHLRRDLGLLRIGSTIQLEKVYEPNRLDCREGRASPMVSERLPPCEARYGRVASLAADDRIEPDKPSRAA